MSDCDAEKPALPSHRASPVMLQSEHDEQLNELYTDRNNAVQLALRLAEFAGLKGGIRDPVEDPEWPVVVIELPDIGEVAWHIPKAELMRSHPVYSHPYDGHTNEQKASRIRAYCTQSPTEQ